LIEEPQARELATATLGRPEMFLGDVQELREGWYFPYRATVPLMGSSGVIVNKRTGRTFGLGSGHPVERDLRLYDRGWQCWHYDIVVLAIRDLRETLRALDRLRLKTIEPTYENGQVWRVAKTMTELEISRKLEKLPCIFPAVHLYFDFEVLEEVREAGWFTFDAVEYHGPGVR
jgi:hypothetical protein